MSDLINHECGIALIRLRKPLEYYISKYGTSVYGLQKLHLLMQKQHNRGQDGAGIAEVKLDLEPGKKYISRLRSNSTTPIKDIFNDAYDAIQNVAKGDKQRLDDVNWLKLNAEFTGELFLGHFDNEERHKRNHVLVDVDNVLGNFEERLVCYSEEDAQKEAEKIKKNRGETMPVRNH